MTTLSTIRLRGSRRGRSLVLALALLLACGCAATPPARAPSVTAPTLSPPTAPVVRIDWPDSVFPTPPVLRPQVEFWRQVFGRWSLAQAVLHDDRHLNLIYAVVALPGGATEDYRPEQRAYVEGRLDALRALLQQANAKLAARQTLTAAEQQIIDLIVRQAGPQALAGAAERLRSQRGMRERFKQGLAASGRYLTVFERIFEQAGLPRDLALLPHVESSFHASVRSSVGASGMWQFTRGTGKIFLTVTPAVDERLDPVAAARGAARYFRYAHDVLESWPLAVTSYNHGITGMVRARAQYGDDFGRIVQQYDDRLFGFASRNFYAEFLAARTVARRPGDYFPEGVVFQAPLQLDRVVLAKPIKASELARRFALPAAALAELNPAWHKRAALDRLPLPEGLEVWLPEGTVMAGAGADGTLQVAESERLR